MFILLLIACISLLRIYSSSLFSCSFPNYLDYLVLATPALNFHLTRFNTLFMRAPVAFISLLITSNIFFFDRFSFFLLYPFLLLFLLPLIHLSSKHIQTTAVYFLIPHPLLKPCLPQLLNNTRFHLASKKKPVSLFRCNR